jgi:phage gp29-like protein
MASRTKTNTRKPPARKKASLANSKAPRPKGGSIASAEAVKAYRRQRWNPLRTLSPETLTRALDAFEYGDLREFVLMAEIIAERDDVIKSVKPKREKATAHRNWNVLTREKSPAAEQHQQILEDFWKNVRAENAYDRNEKGGIARLIKQMMSAVSYRYAAHHIVWRPQPGKLRATFEFTPLWFFENRTGQLRFLREGFGIEGEEMDESEWMITVGDGLMVACAIAYLAKRFCLQDWLAFSEKFSMPGILGLTSHGKDTAEGKAMKSAVQSFGQDWSAVLYGADPDAKDPIRLVQPNGNPTAMPMPALIERVDRKISALYRGADLSSMSSRDGEGTGASLQMEETDILEADDCLMISETLQQVDRQVLQWHFGPDVEPLAYIEIQPPVRDDKKFLLEAIKGLKELGVRISKADAVERLGFTEAEADEIALGELDAPAPKIPAANSSEWIQFARETGTLGIPRSIMPQIKSSNRAAMVQLLRKHGIDYEKVKVKPADLKPTQAEYSTVKLEKAQEYSGRPREILTSSDNHVVDGHHQWLADLKAAPNTPIAVFRIKAPVMHVLGLVLQMASTAQEESVQANAVAADFPAFIGAIRGPEEEREMRVAGALQRCRAALSEDMKPLGDAIAAALKSSDGEALNAALKMISKRMPEFTEGKALAEVLGLEAAKAFTTQPDE